MPESRKGDRFPLVLLRTMVSRVILRRWRMQALKTLGLLSIVALGVSVFLSIGLTNRASIKSFQSFTELVAGESQFSVRSTIDTLDMEDAAVVRRSLQDTEASLFPTLELIVGLADGYVERPGPLYKLIGVDLLASASHLSKIGQISSSESVSAEGKNVFDHLSEQNVLFASANVAANHNWQRGQTVPFFMGESVVDLKFSGSIPIQSESADDAISALVMDLFALAKIAERSDEIDRIEIVLPEDQRSTNNLSRIESLLEENNPGHWIVESQSARQQSGAVMTLALRSNLRALSALSLIVALLLVFQALDSSVSRRKSEMATLRSLGVSPRTIQQTWIIEAALIGAVGGMMGIGLGSITSRFSAAMVNDTVSTLYYFTNGSGLSYEPIEIFFAWIVSIASCIIAGWFPARAAARTPPTQLLKSKLQYSEYKQSAYVKLIFASALVAIVAYLCPPLPAANGHAIPIGGYILALALIVLAIGMACPSLEFLPRIFRSQSPSVKIGLSRFRKPVARHRLALGSVIIAVGMTSAMMLLIGSFERTVTAWMSQVIQADVYIRSTSAATASASNPIRKETYDLLLKDPVVVDGGTISRFDLRFRGQDTLLLGFDAGYLMRKPHISWIGPTPDLNRMLTENGAIINESFKERFDVEIGDPISIETPIGERALFIIGIQSDFGNERGSIGVDKTFISDWMGHERAQGLALHLAEGADLRVAIQEWQERYPALDVFSNGLLREQALKVFNQTFAITYALEMIGLFISVASLAAMLFSSLLERRGEIGALRRIGMSRKALSQAASAEGLGISGLGILYGIPLGLAQGWVLIRIVNKQSFGWSLSISVPWIELLLLAIAVLATGALISKRIGWWNSGLRIEQEE